MNAKLYINPPLVNRAYDWKNGPQPKTRKELDKFFNSAPIVRVKEQICEMGRRIYNKGYTDGNGGNLSVRVGEDLVLCSPTLCCKGFMKVEDICLVDMNAGQLCGYRPRTSEVKVHIAMMKATGMNACMHCHPPHCNAFIFAGIVPPNGINPEADIFLNQIPLAPYATPGTDDVAESVAKAAQKGNVVFMENHGIVCGGRDIEEAEWFAENADAYCQVLLLAAGHGAPLQQVGKNGVKDFLKIRKAMGLTVDDKAPLYNTSKFNGYTMKKTGR
ncbi:MAG: class II aldolase/adducin family protein [Kiritimatiellae bacterium]|nr:class II aldolase/adducin family protein [Kiritimatiellia bacterium]